MRIKPPDKRHAAKAVLRANHWIEIEEPRQRGRLAQLAKHNRRQRSLWATKTKKG